MSTRSPANRPFDADTQSHCVPVNSNVECPYP